MRWLIAGMMLLCCIGAEAREAVYLPQGQQLVISTKQAVNRTAVGNPDVVAVKALNKRQLLLTGKALGVTSLMVWSSGQKNPTDYQIHVAPSLGEDDGAFSVRQQGGATVLEGQSESLEAHAEARAALGPAHVADRTRMDTIQQVQADIQIVEVNKTELKSAGFFYGVNRSAFTFASGNSGALSGVEGIGDFFSLLSSNGFLPTAEGAQQIVIGRARSEWLGVISALHNNGYAYTLAKPSLVTLSGQSATFLAGGEFPYPVSNENGQVDIEFKEFGVRLSLTPTVLDESRIMMKVAPEVSELDFLQSVDTAGVRVPALRVRRTDTSIQLGSGESFIISGLISTNSMTTADRFPLLGDLPVIGALFRDSRFDRSDREMIMIVTPHLVQPLAADAKLPPLPGEIYRRHRPSAVDMMFGNPLPEESGVGPVSVGFSD